MGTKMYGSDVAVEVLRRLEVPYVTVNPGASFRGLHDSLVNRDGPELIMTLFEGVSVALAHGYGKAAGRPMAAALHNLVGLQHGSMAIFDAWADSAPVLVIGGSGPADHAQRRPWIDWIHGTRMQGSIVREFVRWDDQPASVTALPESLVRAHRIATRGPQGPTYVAIDALLQEQLVDALGLSHVAPESASVLTCPDVDLAQIADLLMDAEHPVILADFTGRSAAAFDGLRRVADAVAAPVIGLGSRHNIDTGHWTDCSPDRAAQLAAADMVLLPDVRDHVWAVPETDVQGHSYRFPIDPETTVANISLHDLTNRGFIDREEVLYAEANVVADTSDALPRLAALGEPRRGEIPEQRRRWLRRHSAELRERFGPAHLATSGPLTDGHVAAATYEAVRDGPWLLAYGGMRGRLRQVWDVHGYNRFLGTEGRGGLGYAMGASIGAALAHRDDDDLVVNHRTYAQDRLHQTVMAEVRGHPPANVPIGRDIDDPVIDYAALARSQGVEGFGPVVAYDELREVVSRAASLVREERRPVLVDAVVGR